MASSKKWVPMLTAFIAVVLLSGCGGSIENKILGSWKTVVGDRVTAYLEISENRYVIRRDSDDTPLSTEYILTETHDENFMLEAVNPENGTPEFIFEGYFENKNTITFSGTSNDDAEESKLIRVDSIAEEMEKDEKRSLAQAEKDAVKEREEDTKQEEKDQASVKEEERRLQAEKEKELAAATAHEEAADEDDNLNYYRQKADSLDDEIITEAKKIMAQDMPNGFYGQYYQEWDELLNEVWGVLKNTLSQGEFANLKLDQKEWVGMKEKGFAEISDEVASERQRGMDFLAFETKERTYYLIEGFLK